MDEKNNIYILQKKIFLKTLNPNQHPHTKLFFLLYYNFLSQMENQKALKISIVNASSGSLYHGCTHKGCPRLPTMFVVNIYDNSKQKELILKGFWLWIYNTIWFTLKQFPVDSMHKIFVAGWWGHEEDM